MLEKCNLKIIDIDSDGNAKARIQNKLKKNPIIYIDFSKKNLIFNVGDLISALIKRNKKKIVDIKLLKKLNFETTFYGEVFKIESEYFVIKNLSKKDDVLYYAKKNEISDVNLQNLEKETIIKAKKILKKKSNFFKCKLLEIFGSLSEGKTLSLLTIDEFKIDNEFTEIELEEAKKLKLKDDDNRVNLEDLPIITIDGSDAKDFDDAVYAEKIDNEKYRIIVSIADVSFYVNDNSLLDKKAKVRGNSVYLPDMVIPMFPESISNDICSLKENVKRLCFSVEIIVSSEGKKISHKFFKSTIRSHKRFTYEEVEKHIKNKFFKHKLENQKIITNLKNLYQVYKILKQKSINRGRLNLNIPDKKLIFDVKSKKRFIKEVKELQSHRLIEELMILANCCAAEEIEKIDNINVYRVHEKPKAEKISYLTQILGKSYKNKINKNNVTTSTFNELIYSFNKSNNSKYINDLILRTQSQAKYDTLNIGHFGLGLKRYVHFTSPIRRYSDLLVHRKLNFIVKNKISDYQNFDIKSITNHISKTERISIEAERKTLDRYIAYIYSNNTNKYVGYVVSVKKYGLFVNFDNGLAEGLIHKKSLPNDHYIYDEKKETLYGKHHNIFFQIGTKLKLTIKDTDIFQSKISLNYLSIIENWYLLDILQKKI